MPIFFQHLVEERTKLAIWKIEEPESFFTVPLQRSITHPQKRLQHLAGRYLLRYLFPDFPLEQIKIADTRKPFLENEAFHFSISHCGGFAAAIVSLNKRVGIDIEIPTEKVFRIREKFLHKDELDTIENNGVPTLEQLTLLWSCKEAVFKWWSYGHVDFSEMIRIGGIPAPANVLSASFISDKEKEDLLVHYRLFESLCACWVAS